MKFGDLVFATSPETGMFYGIYADEGRCWKYCTGAQELINHNVIWCTFIKLAGGGLGGNWFEQQAKKIEVGSEVWCSDACYETAIEKPHMTFVVIGKGKKGYRTVYVEDVEDYNKGHQVAILPWSFAVPTGRKVDVADLSVKKKKEEEPLFFNKAVPKFQPGDLVECVEGNRYVLKGNFYRVVKSYPHPLTGARSVTVERDDGFEIKAYERRFVLVPKGDKWSFEITNGDQIDSSEIAENLTRKKPIIYYTGAIEGKVFFSIHNSFIYKWQLLKDLWDEAHKYLIFVQDHETYCTYFTDLSNIDKLLHIFRAVKKHPWPADGYGRRKVEVFRPVL